MTHNTQFLCGNPKRENQGNRDIPLYKRVYKEEQITTLFSQSASTTQGSWRLLSHSYRVALSRSLFTLSYSHHCSIQYVMCKPLTRCLP